MRKTFSFVLIVLLSGVPLVADGGGPCQYCHITEVPYGMEVPYNTFGNCRDVTYMNNIGNTQCQGFPDGGPAVCTEHGAYAHCHMTGGDCEYSVPDPPPTDDQNTCDGYTCSPLVLNLGNGPWRFSGAEDAVTFDLDADGVPERRGWPARGSQIAFLAIDHGLDGVIASGAELFGNRPGSFVNGFETLKVYDSDHDGLIDHNDSVWPFLRLWTDVSHDGVSQAGELQTLDQAGVQGLDLSYHETARADRNDNEFRQQAIYWRGGQARPYYDVWLVAVSR